MKGDFRLGEFLISPELRTICREGASHRIEPKAMRVLALLAQEVGQVVSKERLIQTVWGHSHVTDDVLIGSISCLRKAFNDSARAQKVIQTIPKGGYRLIGPLEWIQTGATVEQPRAPSTPQLSTVGGGQARQSKLARKWALALTGALAAMAVSLYLLIETSLHPPTGISFSREPRAFGSSAIDAEAHRLYLLGRYYWNQRTPSSLDRAVSLFQQAIDRDRHDPSLWAALADAYNVMPDWGSLSPGDAFPRSKAAALEALRLDPELAEAHAALAYAISNYDWDWGRAEQEFQRALQLNPNYASAHQWYAMHLASLGRFPEAIVEIRQAQRLDPVSPVIGTDAAEILYAAEQNEPAAQAFRQVIDLEPRFAEAHAGLARVYERLGKYDTAAAELTAAAMLDGDRAYAAELAREYNRSGDVGLVHARINRGLRARAKGRYGSAAEMAGLYTALGQEHAALQWLETARNEHDTLAAFFTVTPEFDAVRSDARFIRLANANGWKAKAP